LLLQFSCLLVDEGAAHIHNAGNKKQDGTKLRTLMTYAWPCLMPKNCVDPATRYHGHLLLSHIIAKFAIHKRIVLQVFHSLLKAHAVEARNVVRQALEILTPSMPGRMEDGNTMLTHWTKKIILEEGHTGSQLVHILQLVVKHFKVYYPVRHHLIQHIVSSIQRLGFNAAATIEQKKLAVDLCEIAIKWEVQRSRDDASVSSEDVLGMVGMKRPPASDVVIDPAKKMAKVSVAAPNSGGSVSVASSGSCSSSNSSSNGLDAQNRPLNKVHSDSIVNYLLRLACQVGDTGAQGAAAAATGPTQGELLSRRCVQLLKTALKPDIWGNCDLKLMAFDKILDGQQGVQSNQPNFANICTCLDILTFLLTVLRKDQILQAFKPLQKAIATCMKSNNSKVIRAVHSLMSRLMNLFPTEPTNSPVASKYEELAQLYASVGTVIQEGLLNFEKNLQAPPATLFGTLMMLKAACISNSCYIDRLISSFMRVLQRLAKEHLQPTTQDSTAAASELLILSLDLVKNRVAVMGQDIRKAFIGTILVGLIEKSTDVKVMKAITKMLEDWMKNKDVKMMNQGPNLKEKSILLVKMMQYVEKRFPEDAELNGQFLELINYVYRDDNLKNTELTSKLEPAFLSGLRCPQPHIRAKFFEVFDTSMRKRLYDRLLYIVCSQNWESMGPHYWVKQCLELVMSTASAATPVTNCSPMSHLPAVTSVIATGDANERNAFTMLSAIKEEPMLEANMDDDKVSDELAEIELSSKDPQTSSLNQLIARQYKFLETVREHKTIQFLSAMCQLAHMEHTLAEDVWLNFFPSVWKILHDKQRESLSNELVPFICSGAHIIQRDCHPSALNTFVEAVSRCRPIIDIRPALLKYLGKSHNLWHRSTLLLEQRALDSESHDAMDALSEMYSLLKEEDMWAG
jgi:transformation/transcription domain-associated protein